MVKAGFQAETLPDDSYEYIVGDGDPDLRLHGVLAGAIEGLDAEVLLGPLEEQLHLPAAFVYLCDGQCG